MTQGTSGTVHLFIACEPIFEIGTLYTMVLKKIADNTTEVCIDMTWIEHLHSPSLAELVRIYVHLQKMNIELSLKSLNRMNRSLLEISRLDTLITVL